MGGGGAGGEICISIVCLYIQHYMFNYSLYIIVNKNILFHAIVTRIHNYVGLCQLYYYYI